MNELDMLYQVANDYEAATLDDLRIRAGQTWEHSGCSTNLATDARCANCGLPRWCVTEAEQNMARGE